MGRASATVAVVFIIAATVLMCIWLLMPKKNRPEIPASVKVLGYTAIGLATAGLVVAFGFAINASIEMWK